MPVRGHRVHITHEGWRYSDDNTLVVRGENRACTSCGEFPTASGHDACIANLPGVSNACCGHGNYNRAYIQFADKRKSIYRMEAVNKIKELQEIKV